MYISTSYNILRYIMLNTIFYTCISTALFCSCTNFTIIWILGIIFFAVLHDDPHPDPQTSLDNMVLSPSGPYIPGEGDYQYGQSDRMVTSTINDKKKKGAGVPGKSIEEELCRICGDRASGYHYNALSCEGCKGGWPLSRCCVTVYCRFLAIWYKTAGLRN